MPFFKSSPLFLSGICKPACEQEVTEMIISLRTLDTEGNAALGYEVCTSVLASSLQSGGHSALQSYNFVFVDHNRQSIDFSEDSKSRL